MGSSITRGVAGAENLRGSRVRRVVWKMGVALLCGECWQVPCPGGCPNADTEKADSACALCGGLFYEDELEGGVCEDCAVGRFCWELGREFVQENPVAFFEWLHQISYRTNDNHPALTALFWKDMFVDRMAHSMAVREENEGYLRDYCLESGEFRLAWIGFLKGRRGE